jgi:cyclohexanone monooxygenase
VVGTGSSGVQMIPIIAQQARQLTVFQRTANFSLPARNGPMEEERERKHKAEYPARRAAAMETPFAIAGYPKPTNRRSISPKRSATRPTSRNGRKAARSATSMPIPTCW